jgi:predicted nuclease with TOPRIM domain
MNDNEQIKKLEKEKAELLKQTQQLDEEKNKLLTRVIEIQGIIKYIKESKINGN